MSAERSLVATFVVPGVGSPIVDALVNIIELCPKLEENEEMCTSVYKRLVLVSEELNKISDEQTMRQNRVLHMYGKTIANFLKFLKKQSQKTFIKRLASNRKVVAAIQDFNEDIDELYTLLNLAHIQEMAKWRREWDEERRKQEQMLLEIAANQQRIHADMNSKDGNLVESLAMFKYEITYKKDQNSPATLDMMKRTVNKIMRTSRAKVPAVPEWFISSDDVEFDTNEAFGMGSYCAVTRGTWGKGAKVVIKSLLMDDDQDAKASFFREVEVWSTLNNPHIVRLFGACHVSTPAFFVCEDATGGNFVDRFEEDRSELWRLFYEAALGLFYLHSRKVVHGDLKCNNIVIGADNRAKLIDFGFAFVRKHSAGLSAKSQTEAIRWKAPECWLPEEEEPNPQFNPRFASDVFSFGMCIIEAFLGEPPYCIEDDDIVMEKKFSGEMYPRVGNMTDDEWTFVERLLDADWTTRMPLEKAIDTLKAFADREAATKAVDAAAPETRLSRNNVDKMDRVCPGCSTPVGLEFSFCGACGHRVAAFRGIPPLVELVTSGNDAQKVNSTGALSNLSVNAANKETIATAGGIPPLVELVSRGNGVQKEQAAGALWDLLFNSAANQEKIASAGGIPPLVELVSSGNDAQKVNAAGALLSLSANSAANKEKIASAGGIPLLVELVRSGNDFQKQNAAGVLWNLALENTKMRDLIVAQSGAVDQLVNLVLEGTQRQRERAAGVLGFLVSRLPRDVRTKAATQGGIEALLLWIIRRENTEWIHEGLIALQGLCTDDNETIRQIVKQFDGHLTLGSIRESGNARNKMLADQILEWLEDGFTGLSEMCQRMGEAAPLCAHVMERIKTLHDRRVDSVGVIRTRLRAVLVTNGEKSMIARIVSARSLSETLAGLHRELDLLEHEETREMWRSQWELDTDVMIHKLFEWDIPTLINSLGGDAAVEDEAVMLVVHEVKKNKSAYTKPQLNYLRVILSRLAGFSSEGIPVEEKWFIPPTAVKYDDESIHCGSFGKVYHGKYMKADVVVKCVDIMSKYDRENFLREVNVWHEASRHPNIVPFFGACPVGNPCFIVSKYVAGGPLRDYTYRQRALGRSRAWKALLGVTRGLQYLHSKGIVHGGLKGNKILLDGDTAMLTGFCMSFFAAETQPEFGNLGAIRWRAPEFIATKKASFETDVYSLGMCIVEAVTGELPWGIVPDSAVKWHLINKTFLKQPKSMSDDEWALVCAMCDFDPSKRMALVKVEQRIREFADMEEEVEQEIAETEDKHMHNASPSQTGFPMHGLSGSPPSPKTRMTLTEVEKRLREIAETEAMKTRKAFPSHPGFPMHGLPSSPPSQKTLANCASRALRMPETERFLCHLLERLQYLHEPVAPLAVDDHLKLKYIAVVGQLVNLTRRQPLLLRLARGENSVTSIRELHQTLDDISQSFGLDDEPAMIKWKQEWDADLSEQVLTISQIITRVSERILAAEFQGERKAEEALMVLQSSINRKGQLPGMSALKQSTIDRVKRYLRLDSLPVYSSFISSLDIMYEKEPFRFGGYGEMHQGTWLCNGERREVAIQLPRGKAGEVREFISRLEWLSSIPENDHVLKVYGGSHLGAPPFYVYENAPFGTLIEFLSDERNAPMFWRLFEQAAEGLKFLHRNGIAHGDLRCSNIVIGENCTVKLLDVGGSTLLRGDHDARLEDRWKPVEQLRDQADEAGARRKGDVYSLGMCMIEAITLDAPFGYVGDESTIKELILTGKGHPRPDGVSDAAWTLITAMCNPDYIRRPSIYEVLARVRELARLDELTPISIVPDETKASKTKAETPRVCACCGNNAWNTNDRYCRWCGHITQLDSSSAHSEIHFEDFLSKREKLLSRHGLPAYLKSCEAIDAWRKLYEVAIAVQHLHVEGITHCDLKPANIIIGRDGKAHLAFEHNNLAAEFAKHRLPPPLNQAFRWQPLELLNGMQPTVMSDVYALGVCAIYIVTGNPPWGDGLSEDAVKLQVCNGHAVPPRCQGVFTDNEWSLIMAMCELRPINRLGLDDVIQRLAGIVGLDRTQGPDGQLSDSDVDFRDDAVFSQTQYVSCHVGRWKDAVVAVETVSEQFNREHKSFRNVADLWFSLKHPAILQLFGACYKRQAFVCEYAECGDLRSYSSRGNFTRSRIWQILVDVALGIRYLHSIRVVHGDVGQHNILVKQNGRGKLAGFCCSSQVSHLGQDDTSEAEHKTETAATAGTEEAGFASDVFWFGWCIVDAFCGSQSVNSNTTEARANEPGGMQRPEVFSEDEWELVMDMCCSDPLARIGMPEVAKRLARLGAVNIAIDAELLKTEKLLSVNQRHTLQAMVLEEVLEYEKEEEEEGEGREFDDNLDTAPCIPWAGIQRKTIMGQSLLSTLAAYAACAILTPNLHSQLRNYRPRPSLKGTPARSRIHFVSPHQGLPLWRLSHASILEARQVEVLGNGAFASVSSGIWLGASVALKKMSEVDLDHDQALRQEANLWFKLRHPHIASLFGVCCGGYQLFVCDLVDGGRLDKYCAKQNGASKKKVWGLLHDAAVGLQGLHSYGIVHADLKCDNILITTDGRAQLIDFGLSCLSTCDGGETSDAPRWKAPESLNGAGPTVASDVYSFGMCILQALTGDFPWASLDDIVVVRYVKNGSLPRQPQTISIVEWELVRRMCCFNPDDRLQVDEVVKVLGFFAERDPYVNDQSIRETLFEWGRNSLPGQAPPQQ